MSTRVSEFFAGVRDEAPILLGTVPFGVIFGVIGRSLNVPPEIVMAMSSVVFAGSAQLIGVQLIGAGAPAAILWLTTGIVNLRHMLYSASLAPYLKDLSPLWKWMLSYLLTDEAYAVTIVRFLKQDQAPSPFRHYYLFGTELTLWSTWQLGTFFGVYYLGKTIQSDRVLDFSLAVTFIAMAIPMLKDRPMVGAAIVAGVVAVLGNALPYKLGLMVAAFAGIAAGLIFESINRTSRLDRIATQPLANSTTTPATKE